ncbi:ferritin-like domain-containing protein [Nitrosophilus kaiyonis]|uniref:ferritin-like domain-containing protein n=1 Tax=Nitrosophilus kaiyonis TaxID=2930200 RepID=UPI0024929DB9|nr:ferritin-like domain-containing protein [Nitrosophilus kaiyonis]
MDYFKSLEEIILTSNPYKKIEKFQKFYKAYIEDKIEKEKSYTPLIFEIPSYSNYCKIVDPKEVPKRRRLDKKEGRSILLHAIAHIEYSAIDLALDAAYRFKNLPKNFYDDWLEVANDECRHFLMIDDLLKEIGYKYGDFPVHSGLFEAGKKSLNFIERMAVVPRYLEANGLDANPKIIEKLKNFDDDFAKRMVDALEIILNEEIDHVKKGDYWFKFACEKENIKNISEKYFEIVEKIYPGTIHSKGFLNIKARKIAGFSCNEMNLLSKKIIC